MSEVWKPWRDGTYEVSDSGNIRRAKPGISTFVGRPVRPSVGGSGYAQAQLSSDGKSCRVYVHHAVMEVFVGMRPVGFVVNHKDSNRQNNALENLEYVSQRDNCIHALNSGRRLRGPSMPKPSPKGFQKGDAHWTRRMPDRIARADRMPHSKLTQELVRQARARVSAGEKQSQIAIEYGVSAGQMSRIIRGTRWKAA